MIYEKLRQEAIGLPDDKLQILVEFARFLKQGLQPVDQSVGMSETGTNQSGHIMNDRMISSVLGVDEKVGMMRQFGTMAEKITYVAPDFDSCIDDDPASFGLEGYM